MEGFLPYGFEGLTFGGAYTKLIQERAYIRNFTVYGKLMKAR